jgi:hypothetical protein
MKIDFIEEAELEFGGGTHVDIRFGMMNYGPFDAGTENAPKEVRLGIVGTPETVQGLATWLDRCAGGIEAKASRQPNLFPRFPGFGEGQALPAKLVTNAQLQREVRARDFEKLCRTLRPRRLILEAAQLFLDELDTLAQDKRTDVLVLAVPLVLLEAMQAEEPPEGASAVGEDGGDESRAERDTRLDFRDYLKARAMRFMKPIQLVLPPTYDESKKRYQKRRGQREKPLQDEATRAWNLYTALYYKSGGIPWRIVRDTSQVTACYIGISFYQTVDASTLRTSTAQVFNELGDGIIVRGGQARISKLDRQPHLNSDDSYKLLFQALERYRKEHRTLPARCVLHKTSRYNGAELEGFRRALDEQRVDSADLISIDRTYTRLFRIGRYPPLRGVLVSQDDRHHVLYSRGSVDFFATYPGMYVPRPLGFRCEETDQTPRFLAAEMLALSKMNWNNTQFDGGDPITVRAAQQVADVLKHLGEDEEVQMRYSFYM